jgi:hypothetical protein
MQFWWLIMKDSNFTRTSIGGRKEQARGNIFLKSGKRIIEWNFYK